MIDLRENFFRAYAHATKALKRGDLPSAHKWMLLAERHLAAARRFSDLQGQKHRPGKG